MLLLVITHLDTLVVSVFPRCNFVQYFNFISMYFNIM